MYSSVIDRVSLGSEIARRLGECQADLRAQYGANRVQSCVVDDLLEPSTAHQLYDVFPETGAMVLKKNLGQKKFVGVQMNQFHPSLEEIVYAFQQPAVLEQVRQITGLEMLVPDDKLYAGGVSLMAKGHYLNPHLDNSHDKDQKLFRVLNLLYYVTPDWREEYGGNLQLWDEGPKGKPRTIVSRFNRLVIMLTNKHSWHSVSEVTHDGKRCCVSNYYFSPQSADADSSYHVTTFRGRPDQPVADVLMVCDNTVRTAVRKTFGERLFKNPHVYRKP